MYTILKPKQNNVVQVYSDLWYIFDNGSWRECTVKEQMEISK